MIDFGIKDIIDIILVALLLYYLYRVMKKSGTINIFVGILSIIGVWIVTSGIFEMKLTGTILDKFMNIGLIVLVILFQDQIKRFLVDLGSQNKWRAIRRLIFRQEETSEENHADIMTIVYSCMNMAKTKTGALIVIQRKMPLSDYEKTGDEINANINVRLIENIFFKNSPLHDGASLYGTGAAAQQKSRHVPPRRRLHRQGEPLSDARLRPGLRRDERRRRRPSGLFNVDRNRRLRPRSRIRRNPQRRPRLP